MISIIFTDLDGPILDGKMRHYQCYTDILKIYGGKPVHIDKYWEMKRHKIKRDILLKESNFQGLYNEFLSNWITLIEQDSYLALDILKPDVHKTLLNWQKIAERIIIVTMRHNKETLINQLKSLYIYDVVDDVITCSPLESASKYDAVKHLHFKSAVFIGDTEEDMSAAQKLKIPSIGVLNGLRDRKYLHSDYYVDEINEIDFYKMGLL